MFAFPANTRSCRFEHLKNVTARPRDLARLPDWEAHRPKGDLYDLEPRVDDTAPTAARQANSGCCRSRVGGNDAHRFVGGPANADPSFSLNAVGSDTTQDVMNYMANTAVGGTLFASYNATEPVTNFGRNTTPAAQKIQIKAGTLPINRPNGSGDGLNALRASLGGTSSDTSATGWSKTSTDASFVTPGTVDVARSSSGPGSNATTSGVLQYIPFALDAVTVAVGPSTTIADSFTFDELVNLYKNCAAQPARTVMSTTRISAQATRLRGPPPLIFTSRSPAPELVTSSPTPSASRGPAVPARTISRSPARMQVRTTSRSTTARFLPTTRTGSRRSPLLSGSPSATAQLAPSRTPTSGPERRC